MLENKCAAFNLKAPTHQTDVKEPAALKSDCLTVPVSQLHLNTPFSMFFTCHDSFFSSSLCPFSHLFCVMIKNHIPEITLPNGAASNLEFVRYKKLRMALAKDMSEDKRTLRILERQGDNTEQPIGVIATNSDR